MEAFSQLLNGFAVALTPINLMWCLVGTTLGTAIGVLPGLGPALTIALFGDEYKAFLETETARIEGILKELGLA